MPHSLSNILPGPAPARVQLQNASSSSVEHGAEPLLPVPISLGIDLENREEINRWLRDNENNISGTLLVFVLVLVLAGLWRIREQTVEWWYERKGRQARRNWLLLDRKKRKTAVTVGIIRMGLKSTNDDERDALLDSCCQRPRKSKKVRFVEDNTATVVFFNSSERSRVLEDVMEEEDRLGEVF
ncbi:hypothetical protein PZA11_000610 [Diplocarpon coronariae]